MGWKVNFNIISARFKYSSTVKKTVLMKVCIASPSEESNAQCNTVYPLFFDALVSFFMTNQFFAKSRLLAVFP